MRRGWLRLCLHSGLAMDKRGIVLLTAVGVLLACFGCSSLPVDAGGSDDADLSQAVESDPFPTAAQNGL